MMRVQMMGAVLLLIVAPAPVAPPESIGPVASRPPVPVRLKPRIDPETGAEVLHGAVSVFENRAAGQGRRLALDVIVLPATGPAPRPDPIFFLAGGPGQAATRHVRWHVESPLRRDRELVFVDQRGTAGDHRLACDMPGGDDDLQGFLDDLFQVEVFRRCRARLEETADLRLYTTPIAMDDLDDVRAALGYDRINLVGGSYGTRAALVYLRRHPDRVRTAVLNGVAPLSFLNPLYHAREAQEALELLFAECAGNPECREAFPDLEQEFRAVLQRLETEPATVTIAHPATGEPAEVRLTRPAFAGALRIMMYGLEGNRSVPRLVHRAFEGDYRPFAQLAVESNRALRTQLSFGMLLCVVCSEDVTRIDPETIPALTEGTYLGDGRVRQQMAVCDIWPRGVVPATYGEPVRSEVPVLILSGTLDPVTSPRWGAEAARHLPRSRHVVVPGAHHVGGPCVDRIIRDFLDRGSAESLDTSCVEAVRLPPFELPRRGRVPAPGARR